MAQINFHRVQQTTFTGLEHGINWQTYASDDEPVFDLEPDLDAVAYRDWQLADLEAFDDELPTAARAAQLDW